MKLTLKNLNGELTLLDELKSRGVSATAPCGGRGTCGRCRINANGKDVLACRTKIHGDVDVLIDGEVQKYSGKCNLAVDMGTTNIVASVVDTETGNVIQEVTLPNAQRAYGADVINRIQYYKDGHDNELKELIRNQVASIADYEILSIAGNTIMQCIYSGVDPSPIAVPPYCSKELFWNDPVLAPCISGYVGGDTVAGLIGVDADSAEGLWLFIDLGTNGEIALGNKGGFMTCSCAAGPAFECHETMFGSELIDEIAALIENGKIGRSGRLHTEAPISQEQVRAILLAKAAVRAGTEILLERMGKKYSDISKLIIAGKFGDYINVRNAKTVGLIPNVDEKRIERAGNACMKGAILGLYEDGRNRMREFAKKCTYVELSTCSRFSELFLDNIRV